jgi:hypothetical protein
MGLLWSLYPLIYPYVRVIHRSVEIQALCLREKRRIVFPCDDLGEYNIARIRKPMDRVNEEPL